MLSWQQLDRYLLQTSGFKFSHGYCPDCYFSESVQPELDQFRSGQPSGVTPDERPVALRHYDEANGAELFREVAKRLKHVADRLAGLLERRQRVSLTPAERELVKQLLNLAPEVGATSLLAVAGQLEARDGKEVAQLLRQHADST